MRAIQPLELRPIGPSDVLSLAEDRRLIRRLIIPPLAVEIEPGDREFNATGFEGGGCRVVGVGVGVECGVPQDATVGVVE